MIMPTLFIGHGSPMNAIEDNSYSRAWRLLGKTLPTPSAILVISAHWVTEGSAVTLSHHPKTIHDFYGFPQPLFEVNYPALGDLHLVQRVQTLALPHLVFGDTDWGLDHGTWSVLVNMYPNATIPTVQLSIDITQPEIFHFELGQKLAELRREGVLIIGSGNIVHNLRLIKWDNADQAPYPWATHFDHYVKNNIAQNTPENVINYKMHSSANLAAPTPEHYLPLLYILGARQESDTVTFPVEGIDKGSISMRSVLFQSTS